MLSIWLLLVSVTLVHQLVVGVDVCSRVQLSSTGTVLGGPILINFAVLGDEICIKAEIAAAQVAQVQWYSIGIAATKSMVNTPFSTAYVHEKNKQPDLYLLGGRDQPSVTKELPGLQEVVSTTDTTGSFSFTYQRKLTAANSKEVTIDPNATTEIIWAYGTNQWPIVSHQTGTRGIASINFGTGRTSTVDLFVTSNTIIVLFVLLFVLCFLGVILCKTSISKSKIGKLLLQSRLGKPVKQRDSIAHFMTLDILPATLDLKVGEALVICIYGVCMAIVAVLANSKFSESSSIQLNQKWNIITGHLSLMNLFFLLLPISKIGVWQWCFGISFDRIVKFHRFLGRVMLICVIFHLIFTLKSESECPITDFNECGTQEAIPFYGLLSYLAFHLMAILALEPIRRFCYELFYYSHRVLSIAGLVFVFLHSKTCRIALIFPIAFYGLSLLRHWSFLLLRGRRSTLSVNTIDNVSTLQLIDSKRMVKSVPLGGFYWVCIPSVSYLEWHPFSAICIPSGDGNSVAFAVKKIGKASTFSSKLHSVASSNSEITCWLDGPHGILSIEPNNYNALVLVAGGIGITPWMNVINQFKTGMLPSVEEIVLIWAVQHPNELEVFNLGGIHQGIVHEDFQENSLKKFSLNFFATKTTQNGTLHSGEPNEINYKHGRPVLYDYINEARFGSKKVAVLACGPKSLVDMAQNVSTSCHYDFHKEEFIF